jgi:hypothetical protein
MADCIKVQILEALVDDLEAITDDLGVVIPRKVVLNPINLPGDNDPKPWIGIVEDREETPRDNRMTRHTLPIKIIGVILSETQETASKELDNFRARVSNKLQDQNSLCVKVSRGTLKIEETGSEKMYTEERECQFQTSYTVIYSHAWRDGFSITPSP